ncbi:MAG: hypothetical protein V2A74_09300, partial [bacterium]
LVTPFFDRWSLDGWVVTKEGDALLPSLLKEAWQELIFDGERLTVKTVSRSDGLVLASEAWVEVAEDGAFCRVKFRGESNGPAWLVVALRPYNPEGICFVHSVEAETDGKNWVIEGNRCVTFDAKMDRYAVSFYQEGDVLLRLSERDEKASVECDVGMATAAAMFEIGGSATREVTLTIPLAKDPEVAKLFPAGGCGQSWSRALEGACRLKIHEKRFEFLYDAALRSIVLHSPEDVYPGPFTYKRFWFRDATFIVHAMLCAGLIERAERVLDRFPARQGMRGYFHSQEGEWDSNGQVLWIFERFCRMTGRKCKEAWQNCVVSGAQWIHRKRMSEESGEIHAGLLPAGFSAEHLGNNDYYYWDDFWGAAGLAAAARVCRASGDEPHAEAFRREAESLMGCIEKSLERSRDLRRHPGLPASPHRRMDAGAVGSLVAGYPLQLWEANDARLLSTVGYLMTHCFVHGAFFQDMIHSGINVYLSLHIAQVLLRAGDERFYAIVKRVAELASATGQWPEAIHPRTLGGCMGDGQHVWASAEWVMMMRNMFVREEGDGLVLGSGVMKEWLESGETMELGPSPTSFGNVTMWIEPKRDRVVVSWDADWREPPLWIAIRLPGCEAVSVGSGERRVEISFQD